jgi:hypothetical protein
MSAYDPAFLSSQKETRQLCRALPQLRENRSRMNAKEGRAR